MAFKSWAGLLPTFQPYHDLQTMLATIVGNSVHPVVPWALSYFNGSVVLGFLFGHIYRRLPGRTGAAKGAIYGLAMWIVMDCIFFPVLGKGPFATQAGLGIVPSLFTLLMVLAYSVTLGVTYSVFKPEQGERR